MSAAPILAVELISYSPFNLDSRNRLFGYGPDRAVPLAEGFNFAAVRRESKAVYVRIMTRRLGYKAHAL
jgi:hypothetical protein